MRRCYLVSDGTTSPARVMYAAGFVNLRHKPNVRWAFVADFVAIIGTLDMLGEMMIGFGFQMRIKI